MFFLLSFFQRFSFENGNRELMHTQKKNGKENALCFAADQNDCESMLDARLR